MNQKTPRLSLAEKQELLLQALEARKVSSGSINKDSDAVPLNTNGHIAESFYKIEESLRYRQLQLHREVADRAGVKDPFFAVHDSTARDTTVIAGRELLNFSTYNYLGLNGDLRVNQAAQRAAEIFGTSASASRMVGGERPPHRELERTLAELHGTEGALTFVSGYMTNIAVVSTIVGPRDAIVMDRLVHNSVIQGAKLSGSAVHTFPHNNWRDLDALLKTMRSRYERVLIAVEGLYSMEGDICPLPNLVEIKSRHKALLMVDEAHSVGALGKTGRGVGEHFGVPAADVDIWMGTLSKTFAGCGGYVAGSSALVELLKFTASGFVFSVGMPPPIAAACTEAIRIMLAEPRRIAQLHANGSSFLNIAEENGLNIGSASGYNIIPVIVGGSVLAGRLAAALGHCGVHVLPIGYPAVEEGSARLRFFLSSDHSEVQLRTAIEHTAQELGRLTGP